MTVTRLGGHAVLLSHHVDGMELTCEVAFVPLLLRGSSDALDAELEAVRDLARAQLPQCAVESPWEWQDEPVIVHPSGMRKGTRFCLECSDWMVFVAAPTAVTPRFTVQCRSEYLLRAGAVAAYDEVTEWVEGHLLPLVGGRPDEDEARWRLARLDLAADVMGVAFGVQRLRHFTTRANVRRTYNAEREAGE